MVAVHHHAGVLEIGVKVAAGQALQVLVVVVGVVAAVQANVAAQHGVGQRVAVALDLPAAVDEALLGLRGVDRVQHNRGRARRRVLHAHGHVDAGRHQAVLLVLDRARAHRNVRQQVNQVLVVGGVQHLVCGEEAGLFDHAQVHVAHGLHALKQVGGSLGVGVVEKTLVAGALGAGLIGVDARDDDQLVLDLVGHDGKTGHVVQDRVLAIGRAGANDQQATRVLAAHNGRYLGVEGGFLLNKICREGHLFADLFCHGQAALEVDGHRNSYGHSSKKHKVFIIGRASRRSNAKD